MPLIQIAREDDGIVVITLDDPASRNAISPLPMVEALIDAVTSVDRDPTARVMVLTGAGPVFSSGGNLKEMGVGQGLVDDIPAQTRQNYRYGIQRIPLVFEALEIPVIAAVNGPAIGAGCDLSLMCDVRIAAQSARFAESFVKIAIVPGDGGAWLLPRVVGFAKASEMALTGDAVDADEALRIGLVSQVVPDDQLMPAALAFARRIAVNPRHAVRMTKRLLRQAHQSSLSTVLDFSAAMQAVSHHTDDYQSALSSALNRSARK